ncbi:unnamed protein product [Caenorhabditis sp. 36 PRJEB53466]|nr:unnamed protein product [Caenorhabditis sp. 36 PRJEB53466]
MFYGHDPVLQEIGPYTYAMIERKENIKYLEDGTLVSFRSNKTWAFDKQRSCTTCSCNDTVFLPNPLFMAVNYYKRTGRKTKLLKFILDLFFIAMKIQPIKEVSVCGVLLDSYEDPTLDFIHTSFYRKLKKMFNIQAPDFNEMGYFPRYNKTSDGDFLIKTGKDDIANIGQIVEWNNMTELPWHTSPEANTLAGSRDGINQKPGIGKSDKYEMFQPLACRKFSLSYSGHEGHVNGIPTLTFSFDGDNYDGVANPGYRYENLEKANYFPDWPCGPNHTVEITERCINVSCDVFENWCDKCCNGSFINGTWVLPPGIMALRCQPSRNIVLPVGLFLSTPHFLWSPESVQNSLKGLKPDPTMHHPGIFHLNSFSGHTVGANFRIQFNVPLYPNIGFVWNKLPTRIVPTVWSELDVEVLDYALDYFYFFVVVIQRAVFIMSIVLLVLSALLTIFLMYKMVSSRNNFTPAKGKQEVYSNNNCRL